MKNTLPSATSIRATLAKPGNAKFRGYAVLVCYNRSGRPGIRWEGPIAKRRANKLVGTVIKGLHIAPKKSRRRS